MGTECLNSTPPSLLTRDISRLKARRHEARHPLGQGLLRTFHHAVHHLRARRHIVNQPDPLARREGPSVSIAILLCLAAARSRHQSRDLLEGHIIPVSALDLSELHRRAVLEDPRGVLQRAHRHVRVDLGRLDHALLEALRPDALLRDAERGADVDAAGAEGEGGGELGAGGDATRADVRDGELLRADGLEHEVAHVVLARVSGALEAVEGDDVRAALDGGEGVAGGGALVDDDAAGDALLEARDELGLFTNTHVAGSARLRLREQHCKKRCHNAAAGVQCARTGLRPAVSMMWHWASMMALQ